MPVKDSNQLRSIAMTMLNLHNMHQTGWKRDSIIEQEQKILQQFNSINPAYTTQLLFNRLAQTEINNYIRFKQEASTFQLERMVYVNTYRITGKEISEQETINKPAFTPKINALSFTAWAKGVLPLLLLTTICILAGLLFYKKYNNN